MTPSARSDSGGVRRVAVQSEQIHAAPKKGVAMAQIEGVLRLYA